MTKMVVQLDDEVRALIDARAREAGCTSAEAFAAQVLAAEVSLPLTPRVEAALAQALDAPGHPMQASDWQRIRARVSGSEG